jgi:hypothetical protein
MGLLTVATMAGAPAAARAEIVPQRPSQIAFNARVVLGSVLVVADGPTGNPSSSFLCTNTSALKEVWAQQMSGNDVDATSTCPGLPSGSRVKVVHKTRLYAIDDPTQPVTPYTNDAHLIVEVLVLSVPRNAGSHVSTLAGRTGWMIVDDLAWPAAK